MDEQKIEHTPLSTFENPEVSYVGINARDHGVAIEVYGPKRHKFSRRIVACWNACVGIGTETLERVSEGKLNIRLGVHMFADIEAQNKELREALKALYYRIEPKQIEGALVPFKGEFPADVVEQARSILTKAGV